MKANAFAFAAGSLFAAGLMVGGMTQPAKVIGFLDFLGNWDPTLIVVMAAAIATYFPLFWALSGRGVPLFAAQYLVPTKQSIDRRLLLGASLFGVGWGLAGYCPGPGLVALGALTPQGVLFAGAMLLGMSLYSLFEAVLGRLRSRERSTAGAT